MNCCPENQIPKEEVKENQESEEQFLLNKQSRSEQRMDICRECPDLMALNMCRYCKCFMTIKTRIYNAACPVGKW
jgi:hypothetical protein